MEGNVGGGRSRKMFSKRIENVLKKLECAVTRIRGLVCKD